MALSSAERRRAPQPLQPQVVQVEFLEIKIFDSQEE